MVTKALAIMSRVIKSPSLQFIMDKMIGEQRDKYTARNECTKDKRYTIAQNK